MSRLTLAVLLPTLFSFLAGCSERAAIIEIPNGYVGFVTIDYRQEACPTEAEGGWASVIRVQRDGSGCSKTWNGAEGLTIVRYFYVDTDGMRIRELRSTGWGEGGEIWAQAGGPGKNQTYFFVGSEDDFKKPKTWPTSRRSSRGPDAK